MDKVVPPFRGLVICLTGFSKEERKAIHESTEALGGTYARELTENCTHLVAQRAFGAKYEHASAFFKESGLHIVNLGWFIDSIRLQRPVDECSYKVNIPVASVVADADETKWKSIKKEAHDQPMVLGRTDKCNQKKPSKNIDSPMAANQFFSGNKFYLDPQMLLSQKLQVQQALQETGTAIASQLFVGGQATHIVCEPEHIQQYVGRGLHIVTPTWVLRSVKQRAIQNCISYSADICQHLSRLLDENTSEVSNHSSFKHVDTAANQLANLFSGQAQQAILNIPFTERKKQILQAKASVRRRRGPAKQPCRVLPKVPCPTSLLDTICWSVTDHPSSARRFSDIPITTMAAQLNSPCNEEVFDDAPIGPSAHAGLEKAFVPAHIAAMSQSDLEEVVYKGAFLTILFPCDRFGEAGPTAKSLYSEAGFTTGHLLDIIFAYYKEGLSMEELKVALNTDSRHADKLRALVATRDSSDPLIMSRGEFLGSRRNFEGLYRVGRDVSGQLYELCLEA